MEMYGWGTGVETPRDDTDTGLEESFWQMRIGGTEVAAVAYPERPGEPDCSFYMRTGTCGYGERCRFNHPRDSGVGAGAVRSAGEYPERVGQPVCQYFMRTGTCKFGPSCKYHHPRQGSGSARPISLNYYGYPLRPGEKECSYYARTGQCKFGPTCKFHHPQPAGVSETSQEPVLYPTVQSSSVPSPSQYSSVTNWQLARPSILPASYLPSPYGPMLVSSGVVPVPGWSTYPPPAGAVLSPGGQQTVQAGTIYQQLSPLASSYTGSYPSGSSSEGISSNRPKESIYPERPDQPECQYYMRTGDCKYGSMCRYHHPPGWSVPQTPCLLSPIGLPLRPGAPPCAFYTQHGICKFGPTCKFDHPMGLLSYSPSASSLAEMPVAPYPVGISITTLAPSSSSSEPRPEFSTQKNSFSTQTSVPESLSSGSIGSVFSRGGSNMARSDEKSSPTN